MSRWSGNNDALVSFGLPLHTLVIFGGGDAWDKACRGERVRDWSLGEIVNKAGDAAGQLTGMMNL